MVHLVAFNASSVDINLYYFTKTTDWFLWRGIVEEHMLAFMQIVEDAGSSFAFPSQSIYVEDLNVESLNNVEKRFATSKNQIDESEL